MNTIEKKLWEYIDGTCSPEERDAISRLIERDEVYRKKYEELLRLNAGFANMELDEPSMAFTYNVMETIRTENAMKPLKAAVNKYIIGGIGLFFVFTIAALLVFTLTQINWSAGAGTSALSFTMPHIPDHINSTVVYAFLFVDLILALFLLDNYLRKKLTNVPQN
jgi:anti-sigma factor RsiW